MEMPEALERLSALSHDTRLSVYRLLMQNGPAGLPAGEIAARLELPAATLSFHLNHLRQARLIGVQRRGRSLIYAADFAGMRALLAYLSENCCQGQPAICGLPVAPCACHPAQPAALACEPVAEDA